MGHIRVEVVVRDRLIASYHSNEDCNKYLLKVDEGDTITEVKEAIEHALHIPKECQTLATWAELPDALTVKDLLISEGTSIYVLVDYPSDYVLK
jgi:hypothetical protein